MVPRLATGTFLGRFLRPGMWVSGGLIASGQKSAFITWGSVEVLDELCSTEASAVPSMGGPVERGVVRLCFAEAAQGVRSWL